MELSERNTLGGLPKRCVTSLRTLIICFFADERVGVGTDIQNLVGASTMVSNVVLLLFVIGSGPTVSMLNISPGAY